MSGTELLHDLLDRAAARHGGRPAVSHCGHTMTYAQARAASLRLAGWLREHGVRRGDRVLVGLGVDAVLPALLFACSRAGAVFVPLGEQAPEVALEHVLDDAGPVLVLSDRPAAAKLAALRRIACGGLDAVRRAATGHPPATTCPPPLPVDPVCFIYTSGSTGMPKAVVCTHAQVTFSAGAIQSQLAYRSDDVVYSPLPLAFDYGLYQAFLCPLAGALLQLGTAEEAGRLLLARLREVSATVLPAVPLLAANLARLLHRSRARPPALRLLTNTGAAMPPSVLAALRARIPGLRVQLMFGLTECKRATIMPADGDLARPGSCGRALPGTEVFVVDDLGRRLPAGQLGEVVVRGPNVMAGYWRRPEPTAQRFRRVDDLFPQLHTGDYGRVDADGYLYFAGRRDDLYKERGVRVSVTEVEAAAYRLPGVLAAAVVPPGAGRDGATLLVVSGLAAHEVLTALRDQLEPGKVPARCLVTAQLPVNANGKPDRAALRRLVEEVHGG